MTPAQVPGWPLCKVRFKGMLGGVMPALHMRFMCRELQWPPQ